jgi:septal ring factor EnvC (AmiA/AmiB activator)
MASRCFEEVRRTFIILAFFAAAPAIFAQQADRDQTESLDRRASDRLASLQREAEHLASEEATLLTDLRKLEIERQLKAEEFRQVDARYRQTSADLASINQRLRQLEDRDRAERPGLQARLVEIYKLGQGRYLRMLLSTSDLRRVGQASRTVAALADLDRQRIAEHERTIGELKATRAQIESRKRELEKLRAAAQRAHGDADRAARARNDLIEDIDRRRDLNAQLASELATAQQKLQVRLREVGAAGRSGDAPALPLRPFRGDLEWPAEGMTIRRRFDPAGVRGATSNGMEFAVAEGAPVHAIHDGVVAFADTFSGFGNLVIVDHGGRTFSLYGNLLDVAVKKGAHVERGQSIGSVGTTAAGPAGLYFEMRVDGQPVDPLQWLKRK